MFRYRKTLGAALLSLGMVAGLVACAEEVELTLPTAEEVRATYAYGGQLTAEMSGNVAVLTIHQTSQQLRQAASLWTKATPYIFLFSRETYQLFEDYPGLAAVRAVTVAPGNETVAEALLHREELNPLTWRRALNISGLARRDGTEEPEKMAALVRWGEDHTEFEYNRRYIP